MRRTKTVALLIGIVMLFGVASHVAVGDSGAADQMVVVLVDRYALAASQERVDLLRSFVGLVSTLRAGQHFLFAGLDEPAQRLGPFQPGDPDFDAFQEQIDTLLAPSGPQHDADLTDVLAETFNYLGSEQAQSGSTVYLVVADVPQAALAQVDGHLASVVDLFLESEWPIVGLGFPGASPESSDFLKRVSARSGGDSFELTAPDGLKRLAEKVLRDQAMGSLTELGRGALSASAVLTATLGIAPGTREATILTFREGSYGSLRLSNPHGFEASAGDRTSSSVFDSPHVVIWKLVDPEPGDWTVEVRGTEGVVSAWYFVSNKYRLLLESSGAIPLHAVSTLIAFVMEDHDRVVLDDTALTARITSPDGSTIVHELNDAGVSGDAVARDGYFSATDSPMALKGDYQVELELLWPQLGHRISSRASFSVQPFPSIDVTPVDTDDLHAGERSKVATVFVNIQGQPYAVPASELVSSLAANVDQPGVVEVKPQQLLDQNRAWLYDVFFTTKSYNVPELEAMGCKRCEYLGNAFDPHTHRPVDVSENDGRRKPVGFVGCWEPKRANSIRFLVESGIPVCVWGHTWKRWRFRHPLLEMRCQDVMGDQYAATLCSFEIALCFLRKANRDLQTTRSVEIPACGVFMLAERTDEHLELFEEGKEAEFFDCDEELVEKAKHYLAHPAQRRRIAAAGRQRCLESGYSHHDRLREMLKVIDGTSPSQVDQRRTLLAT